LGNQGGRSDAAFTEGVVRVGKIWIREFEGNMLAELACF